MPVTFRGLQIWAAGGELPAERSMDIIMCLVADEDIKVADLILIALWQSAAHSLAFSFLPIFFFPYTGLYVVPGGQSDNGNKFKVVLTSTYNDTEGNEFF